MNWLDFELYKEQEPSAVEFLSHCHEH